MDDQQSDGQPAPKGPWARNTHAGHPVPQAWVCLLAAHAASIRELNRHMVANHGVTLTAYETLLFLSWAPEGRLRRSDLAQRLLITQGGITYLLKGLEASGLVVSTPSPTDRRVSYVKLTTRGRRRLTKAAADHTTELDRLFTSRFSSPELADLGELLKRLPGTETGV